MLGYTRDAKEERSVIDSKIWPGALELTFLDEVDRLIPVPGGDGDGELVPEVVNPPKIASLCVQHRRAPAKAEIDDRTPRAWHPVGHPRHWRRSPETGRKVALPEGPSTLLLLLDLVPLFVGERLGNLTEAGKKRLLVLVAFGPEDGRLLPATNLDGIRELCDGSLQQEEWSASADVQQERNRANTDLPNLSRPRR